MFKKHFGNLVKVYLFNSLYGLMFGNSKILDQVFRNEFKAITDYISKNIY